MYLTIGSILYTYSILMYWRPNICQHSIFVKFTALGCKTFCRSFYYKPSTHKLDWSNDKSTLMIQIFQFKKHISAEKNISFGLNKNLCHKTPIVFHSDSLFEPKHISCNVLCSFTKGFFFNLYAENLKRIIFKWNTKRLLD